MRRDLAPILERIVSAAGEFHLLPLRKLDSAEERKLILQFLDQTSNQYQEIIENCEVNFTKEIEFEKFRKNFTYEKAEEIHTEFEKIVAWFERVRRRDWFGAPNVRQAKDCLKRCEKMVDEFEARVFAVQESAGTDVSATPTRRRRHQLRLIEGATEGSRATAK